MTLAPLALAAMLAVAEPGISNGSRIELGGPPDSEAPGLEPPGYEFIRTKWSGWSRRETSAEALDRWATIAQVSERVCNDPPPAWKPRWGALGCVRGIVTIMRHESAFWRSVHEGKLRGPAGEVGLPQLHPAVLNSLGIDPETVVGIDAAATERSLRVAVELLGLARGLVEAHESVPDHWFGPSVGAYGSGALGSHESEWVTARVATYAKTATRKPLTFRALVALEGT
jgi:hypothetical protein